LQGVISLVNAASDLKLVNEEPTTLVGRFKFLGLTSDLDLGACQLNRGEWCALLSSLCLGGVLYGHSQGRGEMLDIWAGLYGIVLGAKGGSLDKVVGTQHGLHGGVVDL
ncbi:hypothetical protein U1Q18_037140, partial [Sarracenia purpurea var. burkii]